MFAKGYAQHYDSLYSKKPYKREINFVYNWADKPKSILDIGCGTANYWKYYPKSVELIGLERSEEMIERSEYKDKISCQDILSYKPHYGYADMPYDPTVDAATALFDVLNYIPKHDWWRKLPIKTGGYFIFDLWDKKKVDREGFRETIRNVKGLIRHIKPNRISDGEVSLEIDVYKGTEMFSETHNMYLYSHKDIELCCDKEFEIAEVKRTKDWQCWYKLRRL